MAFKNAYNKWYILLAGIISLQLQCNKRLDCANTVYSFSMGIKAYPDQEVINIGDTIWLEINEPTTLKNTSTGIEVDYSGASNLGSAIGFQALSTFTNQFTVDAAQKFLFLLMQGKETANVNPALYHEFLFAEANNRYLFKLAVIPKESGVFRLVFSNASNVYRKNDQCTKAFFALNFMNTNQHYQLNPNFQGGSTPVGGDYYFKVN